MKKGTIIIISLVIIIILVFASIVAFYSGIFKFGNSSETKSGSATVFVNPAKGLTIEEAVAKFNSTFVLYVLYSIKTNELHNPPLSSDQPKIGFKVDEDSYYATVKDGIISVKAGSISNPDIIITTTKEEAVKITANKEYVQQSFMDGKSEIELLASKTILFAKGYLGLYSELTGRSFTGNAIKNF